MKKLIKSIICIMLTLSLMFGVTFNVSANGMNQPMNDKNTTEELDGYEKICVFSKEGVEQVTSTYMQERESSGDNVEQAIQGVLDLELGSMGYQYIEDACLAELETMSSDMGIVLEEYNVLLPKNRASAPTYYGTYKSRDYYSEITSTSYVRRTVEWDGKFAKGDVIRQWIQNAISLTFCFIDGSPYTIPYTLLTSQFPTGYTVHDESWMDCYCNVDSKNRAVYAKEGNNYILVVNREYGYARPYAVYHFNSTATPTATVEIQFPNYFYADTVVESSKGNVLKMASAIYESGAVAVSYKLYKMVAIRFLN